MGQFHHDLVHMGDLPLVHPVLHLSILDTGILKKVWKFGSFMIFSLDMVGLWIWGQSLTKKRKFKPLNLLEDTISYSLRRQDQSST